MRMRSIVFVLSSTFALGTLGGCGSNEIVSNLKKFRDQMCACSDKDCAEKVHKEYRDWTKEMREKMKDSKPSESVMKEAEEIDREFKDCRKKAEKGGGDKKDEKKEDKKE